MVILDLSFSSSGECEIREFGTLPQEGKLSGPVLLPKEDKLSNPARPPQRSQFFVFKLKGELQCRAFVVVEEMEGKEAKLFIEYILGLEFFQKECFKCIDEFKESDLLRINFEKVLSTLLKDAMKNFHTQYGVDNNINNNIVSVIPESRLEATYIQVMLLIKKPDDFTQKDKDPEQEFRYLSLKKISNEKSEKKLKEKLSEILPKMENYSFSSLPSLDRLNSKYTDKVLNCCLKFQVSPEEISEELLWELELFCNKNLIPEDDYIDQEKITNIAHIIAREIGTHLRGIETELKWELVKIGEKIKPAQELYERQLPRFKPDKKEGLKSKESGGHKIWRYVNSTKDSLSSEGNKYKDIIFEGITSGNFYYGPGHCSLGRLSRGKVEVPQFESQAEYHRGKQAGSCIMVSRSNYFKPDIYFAGNFASREKLEDENKLKGIIFKKENNVIERYMGEAVNSPKNTKDRLNPKKEGYGQLINSIGQYCGQFSDDLRNGRGIFESEKITCDSEWCQDKMQGVGYLRSKRDGTIYIGQWKNGKRHGYGEIYDKEGRLIYVGEFENDQFSGYGIRRDFDLEKGSKIQEYSGKLWKHKRHGDGVGTYFDKEGQKVQEYKGEWIEDKRHGRGVETYFDKEGQKIGEYEGAWEGGKKEGKGKYTHTDPKTNTKTRYEGNWKNDKLNGPGQIFENDKLIYEGEFLNGLRHGKGKIYRNDELIYDGEFKKGKREGSGTSIYIDESGTKTRYEGNWESDKLNGPGQIFKNGELSYEGEFLNGLKHGQGTFYYSDGSIYEGKWIEDKKEGPGTGIHVDKSGTETRYKGNWKSGSLNGHGQISLNDKLSYEGEFLNGLKHGKGTAYYSDGRYDGEFREDKREGSGTRIYFGKSGKVIKKYTGGFINDKKEGPGVEVSFDEAGNEIEKYDGTWKDNKRHGFGKIWYADPNKPGYVGMWENGQIAAEKEVIEENKCKFFPPEKKNNSNNNLGGNKLPEETKPEETNSTNEGNKPPALNNPY